MPSNPSIVSKAQIDQAAGSNPALRQLLQQMATAQNAQATKTSTGSKNAPLQSAATVSYNSPFYVVTFTDPGGAGAGSLTQAAQQAATSSLGANSVQSVIYHQVQSATTLLFDSAGSVETYGGDTGSLQTQFVIGDLTAGKQWFFRFRTSFDGQTWCPWKIINNQALQANVNAVQLFEVNGGQFAAVTLPGAQTVGFGVCTIASGQQIEPAGGTTIANTIGLIGPAGFNDSGHRVNGIKTCSVDATGATLLQYADGSNNTWDGLVNGLSFGWVVPGTQNLAETVLSDGSRWVILTVAGGGMIAVGQGVTAPGSAISFPPGFSASGFVGVCTPAGFNASGNAAHGIKQSSFVGATPTVLYGDGSGDQWTGPANWFAVAWMPALASNVVAVPGGTYVIVPTPSGNVAIGAGSTGSGGFLPLPPGRGYTYPKCLAFSTAGSYNDIGSYMHGVKVANIDAGSLSSTGAVTLLYGDGTEAVWNGNAQWFALAWL